MLNIVFTTAPLQPEARHGLDLLAMAASLEQPVSAYYTAQGLAQLVVPSPSTPDPLKKIAILDDIFDFSAFYTSPEALAESGLNLEDLRVPMTLVSAAELAAVVANQQGFTLRF